MSKSIHDSNSFSFSRRYFNWRKKLIEDDHDYEETLNSNNSLYISYYGHEDSFKNHHDHVELGSCRVKPEEVMRSQRKKLNFPSVSKLHSALTVFIKSRITYSPGLGSKVIVGTLFGYRRGHVHFAFQEHPKLTPAFMIELTTPTSALVREMASGLVRIALECEKKVHSDKRKAPKKLLEEPLWRTYCNGKKCGYAMRSECGPDELKVLKAIEPISMGAGVLPGNGVVGSEEKEVMYMRAKFERVIGSKDSEAFYMMNPDGSGCPELSVYLIRV